MYLEHDLGDDSGVRLVGYVDDIRIPVRRRSPGACRRQTADACLPAGLVGTDQVRAPVRGKGEYLFFLPLIIPEELADDSDLRIGATGLNVAHVQDHQAVRPERRIVPRSAEAVRLPGVQTCAVVIGADVVGPAVTGERPVEEPLGIVRVGHVDDLQERAVAAKLLSNVERLSVL